MEQKGQKKFLKLFF